MSTANIYGFPNAKAHSPRNAFSVSYDNLFTSPAGMLLPAYIEHVKAGDKLKLRARNFTRTRAVNTAAFMSFDEKVDFFFVPYRLLWSAYNQWRLGNTQPRSTTSLLNVADLASHPVAKWSDFVVYENAASGTGPTDIVFDRNEDGVFPTWIRFLDMFGYGLPPVQNISLMSEINTSGVAQSIAEHFDKLGRDHYFNYFPLAAYQCIYMYRYRNEDYEALDPSYYNADSLFIASNAYTNSRLDAAYPGTLNALQSSPFHLADGYSTVANSTALNQNRLTLAKLFTPRFKNWRRDLFTSMKPTNGILPTFNSSGVNDSTSVVVPNSGSLVDGSSFDGTEVGGQSYKPTVMGIDMQQIRQLFALDKFSRLAIYADKNYSSLYEAIFGVKVKEPDVPRYLGTHSSGISIQEIVATSAGSDGTADASTSVLGELAGKGIGSADMQFVFEDEFDEDGIVMGIHYVMPLNYYNPYRINPFALKGSKYDYYYPSFDGLGLQPVYMYERSYWPGIRPTGDLFPLPSSLTSVIGFNTRYHEYKQRVNEVHGSFAPGQPESHWTLTANDLATETFDYIYKIRPFVTDSIFGVNWDWSTATDPFMCFYSFDVTRVSNMEAIGIPNT